MSRYEFQLSLSVWRWMSSMANVSAGFVITVAVLVVFLPPGSVQGSEHPEIDPTRPLWRGLMKGPHDIGFRILYLDAGEKKRFVRVALWYPTSPSADAIPFKFGDYLNVKPDSLPDKKLENWMNSRDRESLGRQFFDSLASERQKRLMNAPVPVRVRAKPAEGKFPLLLHSLGRNGNQYQHTILWEYLASHGYVVATVAQYGKNLRDPTMAFSVRDLKFQLADLKTAISGLEKISYVKTERIGVMGHSSGGVVALWLAADEDRIKAVVGLDGSVNRSENLNVFRGGLGKRSTSSPFLNICRWPHDEYYGKFAENLSGDVIRIGFERGIHFDFQNWPAYQAFANGEEPSSLKFRSLAEAERLFVATAVFTKTFFDGEIKSEQDSRAAIRDPKKIAEVSKSQATLAINPDR